MTLAALDLGELIFVVLFIGLPLLRGIMESRKKKAAAGAPERGGAPQGPAGQDEDTGRDLWERMLHGELPEPDEEQAPTVEPPPPILAVEPVEPLRSRVPFPPPVPARTQDEERVAEALARETAELASRWGEAALQPLRPKLDTEGVDQTPYDGIDEQSGTTAAGLPRRLLAEFDLRAAIVASEVLGPPVSIRRPGSGGSTPLGLTD